MKDKVRDIFLVHGETVPDLPYWRAKGLLREFHCHNEYEILGICSRAEVERFLHICDEYYNFDTDLPRHTDLILIPPLSPPPPQSHVERIQDRVVSRGPSDASRRAPRSCSPTPEPQECHGHRRFGGQQPFVGVMPTSTWEYSGTRVRRHSNHYHDGDPISRQTLIAGNQRRANHPHTTRLREILGPLRESGETQGGGHERSAPSASRAGRRHDPGPLDGDPGGNSSGDGVHGHRHEPPPHLPHGQQGNDPDPSDSGSSSGDEDCMRDGHGRTPRLPLQPCRPRDGIRETWGSRFSQPTLTMDAQFEISI